MPLDLVNAGDSTATVKAKMNAMFTEVGLPISDDTTEATNTFNELVSDYLDDPLPGLADRMNGVVARGRINAAVDALNKGGGVQFAFTYQGQPFTFAGKAFTYGAPS